MRYGIFSIESGNAVEWFDSRDAALEATRELIESEPESLDALGILEFNGNGHPETALQGQALAEALGLGRPIPAESSNS